MKTLTALKFSLYERIWFLLFISVGIALSVFWGDTLVGFVAFISGIICVLLAAKGSKWNYVIGVLNCLTYSWVCWKVGLFGDVIENMAFYLPLQFIGFYMWGKRTKDDGIVEMIQMKKVHLAIITVIGIVITVGFGLFLSTLEGQVNPFVDSFTNIFTIVAALLMLKRFREYWPCYIIVNVVTVVLWVIRLTAGSQDATTMLVMWSAYLVNSIYGAIMWYKNTERVVTNG